jgi:hypothetical protein
MFREILQLITGGVRHLRKHEELRSGLEDGSGGP